MRPAHAAWLLGLLALIAPAERTGALSTHDGGSGPGDPDAVEAVAEAVEAARARLAPGALPTGHAAIAGGWVAAFDPADEAEADSVDFLLLRSRAGQIEPLPGPSARSGPLRGGAVPLTDGRELVALAWLEGSDPGALAVRAARWDGSGWSRAATVSPPGRGSQLALAGAVLADGSALLLWSAFDGRDDEILWSRGGPEAWSAPRRLHADNAVPDITPALLPLGAGAVAAWSRFEEGHYRLRLAVWADGAWRPSRRVGEAGSLFPSLHATGDGAVVLYETVVPRTWSLLELGPRGRVLRRAAAASDRAARPLLEDAGGDEALLRWPAAAGEQELRTRVPWREIP